MKILITGRNGQLGRALAESAPSGYELILTDRATIDLSQPGQIADRVESIQPDVIINAGAYTAVDRAEDERDLAARVNTDAVEALSRAAGHVQARLLQVSTDFVFDGTCNRPHPVYAETTPLSVYGLTKRDGELAAGPDAIIVRTAWVYASEGHNFVRTMLRLMAERPEVRIVSDQISSPTYAPDLAKALWKLAAIDEPGIYHFTNAGYASWYDFAVAIGEEAVAIGLLPQMPQIIPISTEDYPTPAKRPHFSALDCSQTYKKLGYIPPHWRVSLRQMLKEVKANG